MDSGRFQEACEWVVELREQPESTRVLTEWLEWCRADPRNREAFERASQVWQATSDVPAADQFAPADAPRVQPAVSALPRRRYVIAGFGGLAAAVAVALVLLISPATLDAVRSIFMNDTITTRVGENRMTRLADGSSVALGGESVLRTAFDPGMRRVTLERGEAYFTVRRDPARPFVVSAGNLEVTAVGTAFNVRNSADRIIVSVAEGTVAIDTVKDPPEQPATGSAALPRARTALIERPLRAIAGQEVAVDLSAARLQVVDVPTESVASWQSGRLEFSREPLRAVIARVNRYSDRDVVVQDPHVAELHFSGTVFSDRVDDWLAGLPAVFPVVVREDRTRVVIEPKPK